MTALIPEDKQGHFNAGTQLGLVALLVHPHYLSPIIFALVAGIGKEIADWRENVDAKKAGKPLPHGVEVLDVVATVLGGVWVAVVYSLVR